MTDLAIELAPPLHGWMKVRLLRGTDVLESTASYASDCITDLVYAALEITESRTPRDVHFVEEPASYRLRVTGDGATVQLTVTAHRYFPPKNNTDATVAFAAELPRTACAQAMWNAVNQLVSTIGTAGIEAGWQRPFPAKEFAQLSDSVGRTSR